MTGSTVHWSCGICSGCQGTISVVLHSSFFLNEQDFVSYLTTEIYISQKKPVVNHDKLKISLAIPTLPQIAALR